jgi:L-aminopeptidase/D-esterase-like protein
MNEQTLDIEDIVKAGLGRLYSVSYNNTSGDTAFIYSTKM